MSCTQTASHASPFHRRYRPLPAPSMQAAIRGAVLRHVVHTIARWLARSRQRRDLARLDAHLLKDIGVTPGQAWREASKPFWVE